MIKRFICDVDGCLNDGKIYWTAQGKMFKAFGPHDQDGLKLLKPHVDIEFITADQAGWDITYSRIVTHSHYALTLVPEDKRYDYVSAQGFENVAYMGDGFHDAAILKMVQLGIAPRNARIEAKEAAGYVTASAGGEGAVMDACLIILRAMNKWV